MNELIEQNPTLYIDFVLQEVASLSILTKTEQCLKAAMWQGVQ